MERSKNIIASGTKVILTPSVSKHKGRIVVPDTFTHRTSMCKVLSIGEKVELLKEGDVVLCRGMFSERQNHKIEGLNAFICEASFVFAKLINKKIYPIGNRVLILRDIDEQEMESGIIIPAANKSTDQSLFGTIIRFGIRRGSQKSRVYGLNMGDRICLGEWKADMIEVGVNYNFGLIINEEDMIYKFDDGKHQARYLRSSSGK